MAPSESSGVLALGPPRTLPAISRLTLLDRLLSALLGLWGLGCLLPIAVWLGVADGDAYQRELAVRLRGIGAAALAAALLLILTRGRCTAWLHATARRVLAVPRSVFLVALGGLAVAEAIGVSVLCFARNPQLIDTWAQYVQARSFSAATLAAVPPPSLAHFGILQMVLTPAGWFAQYPPVHPALLALGMGLGVPWLITPLLAGVLPAATYWLGRQSGDERIARLAAALVLLSPFAIAMDASAMNHLPAALCAAAGLALLPALARGRSAAAGGFGVLVGLAAGIRPLDALALALVGAGALLICVRARALGPLLAAAAGGALGVLPTLLFNAATSGYALTFGYTALYGAGHGLGFHAVPWGEPLTPLRAVGLTAADADQLNTYLLEWPLPATVLVVAALLERRGLDPARRAAAAYLAALVGLLFFYFHRDLLYGPRFLFSALPAVFVLVAAGIVALGRLERPLPQLHARLGDAIAIAVVAAALPAALWLAPLRLASYSISRTVLALHPDDDARRAGLHHTVVVVRDGWGTRLIVRMWDAGVPVTQSAKLYSVFDACTLEGLLDQADADAVRGAALTERLKSAAPTASPGQRVPGLTRDPQLRLPAGGQLTPACAAEIEWDRAGTLQYAALAYLNAPDFNGDIVWARDMPDLSGLRSLYPDRPIYRYAQPPLGGDPTFTKLD